MMKPRFFPIVFLLLALAGCPSPAGQVAAPAASSGAGGVVGTEARDTSSTILDPTAHGPIDPRPDSERVPQGLVSYVAYYGPDFSWDSGSDKPVYATDGRLSLPLRIQKEVSDVTTQVVTKSPAEPGMQLRLVLQYPGDSDGFRYVACDTMTTAVQADGSNADFSGANLPSFRGTLFLFYVVPDRAPAVPTADFSAACVPLGDTAEAPSASHVTPGALISGYWYEILGRLPLMNELRIIGGDLGNPVVPDVLIYEGLGAPASKTTTDGNRSPLIDDKLW